MIRFSILALIMMPIGLVVMPEMGKSASAKISSRDCQRMVKLQSSADYKPGVDVRGKKVKSADAEGGSTFKLPKEFSFDIGVDIAAKYGLDAKKLSADLKVGKVTVRGSRVFMDGKEMTTNDRAALAAKCEQLLSGK